MASERVEFEIKRMYELPTHSARMQYIHSIPKGIRARVVGEVLDRGNAVLAYEKGQSEMRAYWRSIAERDNKPVNPFSVPSL
jgi:hypothetical protein